MKYMIRFPQRWETGRDGYHAGDYRVPEDISEERAQEALKCGAAMKKSHKRGAPENKLRDVPPAASGLQSRGSGQGQRRRSSPVAPPSPSANVSTSAGDPEPS